MRYLLQLFVCLWTLSLNAQGPYAPAAGQPGSNAIHKDSTVFIDWAIASTVNFGWINIADTSQGKTSTGNALSPTGMPGINGVVSLGDSGYATLTFNGVLYDGSGADFAVFENGFGGFLELAFVEVSSDGINFFRFDAVSLTDTSTQTNSFGSSDPTNLYNIAGKYVANYGTPFDLNELSGTPGLNINAVTHIRIVDVVGSIDPNYASYDSQNRAVNDPWPTAFATGGFDLDAVGAIHLQIGTGFNQLSNKNFSTVFPNPTSGIVNLNFKHTGDYNISIINYTGKIIYDDVVHGLKHKLSIEHLDQGVYFVKVYNENYSETIKLIKN